MRQPDNLRRKPFRSIKHDGTVVGAYDRIDPGHAARRQDKLIDKGANRHVNLKMVGLGLSRRIGQIENHSIIQPRVDALLTTFARRRLRTQQAASSRLVRCSEAVAIGMPTSRAISDKLATWW